MAVVLMAGPVVLGARALSALGVAFAHQCVPGQGPFAWLGMRMALVRSSYDCPEQMVALGGAPEDVGLVIATIALPILLLHGAGFVVGVGLVSASLRWFGRCAQLAGGRLGSLVRALIGHPSDARVQVPADISALTTGWARPAPRLRALVMAPALRGPPWNAAAC